MSKNKRIINIHRQRVPDDHTHDFGITIHSKDSERNGIEYDLICILYDAIENHIQFKDIKINDYRSREIISPGGEIAKAVKVRIGCD